jgi:hypothetical protein
MSNIDISADINITTSNITATNRLFLEIYLDDAFEQRVQVFNPKPEGRNYVFNEHLSLIDVKIPYKKLQEVKPFCIPDNAFVSGALIVLLYGLKKGVRSTNVFSLYGSNFIPFNTLEKYAKSNSSIQFCLYDNSMTTAQCQFSNIKIVVDFLNVTKEKMIEAFTDYPTIGNFATIYEYAQKNTIKHLVVPPHIMGTDVYYSHTPFGNFYPEVFVMSRNPIIDDNFLLRAITMTRDMCDIDNVFGFDPLVTKMKKYDTAVFLAMMLSTVTSSMEYTRDRNSYYTKNMRGEDEQAPKEEFSPTMRAGDCEEGGQISSKLHLSLTKHVSTNRIIQNFIDVANLYDSCLALCSSTQASTLDNPNPIDSSHMLSVLIEKKYFDACYEGKPYIQTEKIPLFEVVEGTGIIHPLLKTTDDPNVTNPVRTHMISGACMRCLLYFNHLKSRFYKSIVVLYNPRYIKKNMCLFTASLNGKYGADINEFMSGNTNIRLIPRKFPCIPPQNKIMYDLSRLGPPTIDFTKTSVHKNNCICEMCRELSNGVKNGKLVLEEMKKLYYPKKKGKIRLAVSAQLFNDTNFISFFKIDVANRALTSKVNFDYELYEIGETKNFVVFL